MVPSIGMRKLRPSYLDGMTGEIDDRGRTAFQFLAELLDSCIHIGMSRILRINHVKTASLQELSDPFRVCNRRTDRRCG